MKKKAKKFTKSHVSLRPSFIVIVLALFLAAISYYNNRAENLNSGSQNNSSNHLIYQESLAKSLDLRISSKAAYPGGNIDKTDDLGVINNTHLLIVRFPVPNDNLHEYALMSLPTSPPPKNGYPLIILCHGYVNPLVYSTTQHYVSDMEFYSSHGFAVIKPDFRGQGLSSAAGKPEGAYFSMAYNTDLMSLISSAKRTSYIDKYNINLWGHSMGAYIALRASTISPDVKNVILLAGVVGNERDLYSTFVAPSDSANPSAQFLRKKQLLKHGDALANSNYWYNVSPLNFLKNSHAHYQVYVGSQDQSVSPSFSAHLNNALENASVQHFYRVFPQGDHGLVGERPVIWNQSLKILATQEQ